MAKIPFNMNTTWNLLFNQAPEESKFGRNYLGMSGIASECHRKPWLSWRWASPRSVSFRTKRIFERGDLEEARVIRDLKSIGYEVFRRDEDGVKHEIFGDPKEPQEQVVGFASHAKGHLDGRVLGVIEAPDVEHLLEIKTMKDSTEAFKKLVKHGVEIHSPVYYGQVQRYMERTGLTRCLHITVNKNTEEMYIERIRFHKGKSDDLIARESHLIRSEEPADLQYNRAFWKCKVCDHFGYCHDNEPPQKSCRSCRHVDLAMEGKWLCAFNNDKELSTEEQQAACCNYEIGF